MNFASDFFGREIRCDFEISEMMKRAWAAKMEILEVFIDVCERHQLQYFADGGTLLGAVRHQGFIPWDDDIDICMKREDYMQLVQILPGELPSGIAMAGMYADTERMRRMSLHPYIEIVADINCFDFNEYMKRFHGCPYPKIAIDIFPLDYLPRDPETESLQRFILALGFYVLDNWKTCEEAGQLEQLLTAMEGICATAMEGVCATSIPRNENTENYLWNLMDKVSALCREDGADQLVNYYYYIQNTELCLVKECYEKTVTLPFEQMNIAAPDRWDEILTVWYGDYMVYDRNMIGHTYPFYKFLEHDLVKRIRKMGFSGTVEEFCRKVSGGDLCVPEDKGRFWE